MEAAWARRCDRSAAHGISTEYLSTVNAPFTPSLVMWWMQAHSLPELVALAQEAGVCDHRPR